MVASCGLNIIQAVCCSKCSTIFFLYKFVGSWVDDQRCGNGKYFYVNGDTYDGEWQNHVRHGQGCYTFAETGRQLAEEFNHYRYMDTYIPTATIECMPYSCFTKDID